MPRTARLRIPGAPLHIVQRGHSKQICFFSEAEHELYLGLLQEFAAPHGCAIHAYVLMTNHVHLLLTPAKPMEVSALMSAVNQRYGQRVNRVYGWSGSLWQGRFWCSPIESERYLLTCQRYIEMNPVRAGMVNSPGDYPWSSYSSNAAGASSRLLTPHSIYRALGDTPARRQTAYRALFSTVMSPEDLCRIREAAKASRPLGTDEFLARVGAQFGVRTKKGRPGPSTRQAQDDGQLDLVPRCFSE